MIMTIPHNTYKIIDDSTLWIFGIGTLRTSKTEANKDKDQVVRESLKCFDFFGKQYWIRLSAHAIKTAIRDGYKPIN